MYQKIIYKTIIANNGVDPATTWNQAVGLMWPVACLGGSWSFGAWSETDFPREYAARVKQRVMPLVGNNSEQVRFPVVVDVTKQVWVVDLFGPNPRDAPPAGWWYNPKQRPRPLWFSISGVTKDSTGASLGSCTVKLYQTLNDLEVASAVSDGAGNYAFWISAMTNVQYYVVAYKVGSPDVAGTTVNTLNAA